MLSRGTWLDLFVDEARPFVGVVSSPLTDEPVVDPTVRLRERIVTVAGTLEAPWIDERGEARGGVLVGPGSFERADCTRASSRCICAVSERMWDRELEAGSLCEAERGPVARFAGVRSVPPVEIRLPGARFGAVIGSPLGLGVVLLSEDGNRDLRAAGVLAVDNLGRGAEASDMGGEGGSRNSESVSRFESDFESGGVVMRGELAVDPGEASRVLSKVGDPSMERSVEMAERCRDSYLVTLS